MESLFRSQFDLQIRALGDRIASRAFVHKLTVYIHDIVVAGIAFSLSLFLAVGFRDQRLVIVGIPELDYLVLNAVLVMVIAAAVFFTEHLYRSFWRYVGFGDFLRILRAATLVVLLYLPISFLASRGVELPRSTPILNWFFLVGLLTGPRLFVRMISEGTLLAIFNPAEIRGSRIPVILVGVGAATDAFLREMTRNPQAPYRVVGILTDRPDWQNRRIHGAEIMGSLEDAPEILNRLATTDVAVEKLILTESDFTEQQIEPLLDLSVERGLSLDRVPRLTDFQDGSELSLRPVAITDLLGRPQVNLDQEGLEKIIRGRRVLVTGAGGSIGSELVRQIATHNPAQLCLLDQSEFALYQIDTEMGSRHPELQCSATLCDVRNRDTIFAAFKTEAPDLVFHAAALKHVPLMEDHPSEAVLTNVIGTQNVADACVEHHVGGMVMISTDKAVNPANIMGATKRLAEAYCQALDINAVANSHGTRFITVRFGNVLGSNGSVVPLFQSQLAAGGPLTVTHPDVERFFMTIPEAVRLILQATVLGVTHDSGQGSIFVLDMGKPIKIIDLARKMIRLSGKEPEKDIKIKFIGLRPGEKLFEELSYDTEALTPVDEGRLFLATPMVCSYRALCDAIDGLATLAREGAYQDVTRRLTDIVSDLNSELGEALRKFLPDTKIEAPRVLTLHSRLAS